MGYICASDGNNCNGTGNYFTIFVKGRKMSSKNQRDKNPPKLCGNCQRSEYCTDEKLYIGCYGTKEKINFRRRTTAMRNADPLRYSFVK